VLKAAVAVPRARQAKRIPIPDPTPDEPEPILREDDLAPEIEPSDLDVASVFGIPAGPPGPPGLQGRVPLEVGDGVAAPVKIYAPPPRYTDEARLARVQGVVVLRTVIDTQGNVVQAEVLKGLPQGLTESAVQTVSGWKFEPATRAGEPVPVYFMISISFSIQ
jgi:TonB family protein